MSVKSKWLPLVLILILLLSLAGCGTVKDAAGPVKTQKVTVTTRLDKEKLTNFNIDLKIPVITGMNNAAAQKSLNSQIADKQIKLKNDMKPELADYVKFSKESGYPVNDFDLSSDYSVSYNQNDILSITATIYNYTGGAHGMTEQISYNIDLKTGKLITLKDIFKSDSNYIKLINKEISKQIKANPDDFFTEDDLGFKTIAADQPFYFNKGGITVYFQLYEIAPYAGGIKEFKISNAILKPMIKERYIP